MIFLVVSDIDVHQLNLRPFINLQFLVENPFKKCVYLQSLNNKCEINSYYWGKTITLRKRRKFYKQALYYFSFFLGSVMCYEPQT
jgi:hypothetical protein